jgi:hypoxanthine phosphoribosyltransferase
MAEIKNGLQESIALGDDKILIGADTFIPLIKEEEIQQRNRELGKQISVDFAAKSPVFIGVLNGAFVFLSDLFKNVTIDCEVDFIKLSSYRNEKTTSGTVKILKELSCDVFGRNILIVEDIVDSGLSIKFIEELLTPQKPASMKIVSLLVKPNILKYNVKIDYIGFKIPDKFVIGYGLDYAQKYRNLKSIYRLSE